MLVRCLLIMMLIIPKVSFADAASEDAVKAAFIYHFINFTHWEDDLPEYDVCIPDDKNLREITKKALAGKVVNDRKIVVVEQAPTCHVLVSNYYMPYIHTMLTIGALDKGALMEFRKVNQKLKFAIKLDKIKNSQLKISSQLLKLAILE